MKTNFAIAALISAAALLTPAYATPSLMLNFTGYTSGSLVSSGTAFTLTGAPAGLTPKVTISGYTGIFTTTSAPPPTTLPSAVGLEVKTDAGGTKGIGLTSPDAGAVGPGEALLLDFSNMKTTMGSTYGLPTVEFDITRDITDSSSHWLVWGSNNGTSWTEVVSNGSMGGSAGSTDSYLSPNNTPIYTEYLIGLTNPGCAFDLTAIKVNYPGTPLTGVPEPGTFVMAGAALIGLGVIKKRARKA